jgi:hypothetical protein
MSIGISNLLIPKVSPTGSNPTLSANQKGPVISGPFLLAVQDVWTKRF